jgi:hypothetical protein
LRRFIHERHVQEPAAVLTLLTSSDAALKNAHLGNDGSPDLRCAHLRTGRTYVSDVFLSTAEVCHRILSQVERHSTPAFVCKESIVTRRIWVSIVTRYGLQVWPACLFGGAGCNKCVCPE